MTKSRHKDNFLFFKDSYGEFYFTNKRFTRMVSGIEEFSKHLARAYLLIKLNLMKMIFLLIVDQMLEN